MRLWLGRFFGAATVAAVIVFAAASVYGMVRGPVAPIYAAGGGYQDRLGNQYTAAQYADFQRWKSLHLWRGAAVFLLGFCWGALTKKPDRKPGELAPEEAAALQAALRPVEKYLPGVAKELQAHGPLAKLAEKREQQPAKRPPGA